MRKQLKQGSVCIHFLDFLLRYANGKGIAARTVLSGANLEAHLCKDPDSRIPATTFFQVWDSVSKSCGDKNFGLNMGSSLHHFPFSHVVFSVMLNDTTLVSALKNMTRYHNLLSDIVCPCLLENDDTFVFFIKEQKTGPLASRQHVEFIFAMILTFLRYLSPRKIDPDVIHFSHMKPEDTSGQLSFFNARLIFGAERNEMFFQKKLLAAPVNLSNPDLMPLLELNAASKLHRFNTAEPWSQKVQTVIDSEINSGTLTIEDVADKLAISKRTLQNRLKEEGITFRQLYESSRREKAVSLLGTLDIPIVDIAFLLGFSEQSAFNHAFKKWTGQTPGQYRIPRSQKPSAPATGTPH